MYNRSGSQAYAQVGLESGVMSASPHQLIVMLFDGAQSALVRARILMNQGDIPAKGAALSKAINIINNGLSAGLNMEKAVSWQRICRLYMTICRGACCMPTCIMTNRQLLKCSLCSKILRMPGGRSAPIINLIRTPFNGTSPAPFV